MSSKVTAKLPLGAACSVLLISLALLAGCKQEAPVDNNSYTPPGYGASVGRLTDTVWKDDESGDTIRFGAEGKVVDVPSSWKKPEGEMHIYGLSISGNIELDDFTYSGTDIYGKVTKVQVENLEKLPEEIASLLKEVDRVKVATFTVPRTESLPTSDQYGNTRMETIKKYYEMNVTIEDEYTSSSSSFTFTMKNKPTSSPSFIMENKPTSEDKFVGTYYDDRGRKYIQINKDDTFVRFSSGGQSIEYWKYNDNGTISVQSTPFTDNPGSMGSSTTTNPTIYYLYPHALMRDGSSTPEAYK